MKAAGLLVLVLLIAAPVLAQETVVERGRAYLSFSADGADKDREVAPLEPVDFFLLLELDEEPDPPVRMSAVEGALVYAPNLFLSQIDWGETFSFDIGGGLGVGSYDFVTAWSPALELHAGLNVLGRFTGVLLEETDDVLIEIRRTVKCPWDTCDPLRWVEVGGNVIYRAVVDPREFVALNRSPVATSPASWGAVKALFEHR